MSLPEFKRGILSLADANDPSFISERVVAMRIFTLYMGADKDTQRDLSEMLREDLECPRAEGDGE